jgi:uncharacterized membrane protein YhaH (DUF805 family)
MALWAPLGFEDLSRDLPTRYVIMLSIAVYLFFSWPLSALAYRRAHDIGLPGSVLALPTVLLLPAFLWSLMHFVPSGGSVSDTELAIVKGILFASPAVALATFVAGIRPSQPGPNKHGPNPHEVTS